MKTTEPAEIKAQKPNVIIRPARPEDLHPYRELRLEALREHPEAFSADYETDLSQPEQYWRERFLNSLGDNNGLIVFSTLEDRLVGMTGIVIGSSPKTRHEGLIWGVYVRPELRGFRLAAGMIEQCAAWGRRRGLKQVKLGVATTNGPAIRAYLQAGFSVYGVDPEVIYTNGVYIDELLMVKRL